MEYSWELRNKNAQNIKALMCPLYWKANVKIGPLQTCINLCFFAFFVMFSGEFGF